MMQICNELKTIYKDSFFSEYHEGDLLRIDEHSGEPGVEGIFMPVKSDITNISNDFLHKITSIYYKDNTSNPEIQHDCDGILLIHYNNCDYLVLMELKTTYCRSNITKAEKQIAASLFRIICRLKPFNSFDIHNYKYCGIIVSLPLSIEKKRDIKKKQDSRKLLSRFEKQACHFMRSSFPYILNDEFLKVSELPVNPIYIKNQIPIFHVDVETGVSEINIYNSLLKL